MWKIILIISLFLSSFSYAVCLKKMNFKIIKTDKNAIYYEDKKSGIVFSETCFQSDASVTEMQLQYQKSGVIDIIDDETFFHTVKTNDATMVSLFSYTESTQVLSVLKNNKNTLDLKQFLKSIKSTQ